MIGKYYSLDECFTQDDVYEYLDILVDDGKLEYEITEDELVKIKDKGLILKEARTLLKFLKENDVIEYKEDLEDDDEEEEEDDEEDDFDTW